MGVKVIACWVGMALTLVITQVNGQTLTSGHSPHADPRQTPQVDWSHARHAHRVIEDWVAAGAVDINPAADRVDVSGVSAVRVTLRWSGLTVGVGQAFPIPTTRLTSQKTSHAANRLDTPTASTDLIALVGLATDEAIKAFVQKQRDAVSRGGHHVAHPSAEGTGTHATTDATPRSMTAPLYVDLQIAYRAQPILLPANAPTNSIYNQFVPGYHGLRMTRPSIGQSDINVAWMWPGSALAANIAPRSQLVQLLADLGYPVKDLKKIGQPDGPGLQRFDVIHYARPPGSQPAVRLTRGQTVLPPTSLSSRSVGKMAHHLVEFLINRQRQDGQMAGTYLPSSDQYNPAVAPDHDQALATYALSRWVNQQAHMVPTDPLVNTVKQAVARSANDLARRLLHDPTLFHIDSRPNAVALLLMTLIDSPLLGHLKTNRQALASRLLDLRNKDGSFRRQLDESSPLIQTPTQALVLAALASFYEQTRDPSLGQMMTQSLDQLWQDIQPKRLVNALPWLGMAEFCINRVADPDDNDQQERWQHRGRSLAKLADRLRQLQVSRPPEQGPADVVGGFVFSTRGAAVNPDWHSAAILAFLAQTLSQQDLSHSRDKVGWLLDCGLASRFLAQLMFDKTASYYVRSPKDVLGGVRNSLIDNRVGIAASAMTLLAVIELQETVARFHTLDSVHGDQNKSISQNPAVRPPPRIEGRVSPGN